MSFDERTERNLATLVPEARDAARRFLTEVNVMLQAEGVTARIISGTRTYAEQDALFAKGRTVPGSRVTNARGGFSNHNFGIAWDIGLFMNGRYLAESPLYAKCGKVGRELGLEWGGDWKTLKDEPHFQIKTGLTLSQMREWISMGRSLIERPAAGKR